MKKIIFSMLSLLCGAGLMAQTQVMTVYKADGSKQTFKVESVERVAFEEMALAELDNQFALNDAVTTIGSVVELVTETGYRFALYEQEGVTDITDTPAMELFVATALMGKQLDLSQLPDGDVAIWLQGKKCASLSGSLKVSFDRFGNNLTVALDTECESGLLRADYMGPFSVTYVASGDFIVTLNEDKRIAYTVPSVLRQQPAKTGDPTGFAFGDIEVTSAAGYLDGHAAVRVTLTNSALYTGAIDMVAAADSYTFQYFDYETGTIYSTVTAGTLTTHEATDGKVYLALNATLEDGTVVSAEYFGAVTDVESLDAMVPEVIYPNEYTYYNGDGVATINKEIIDLQYSIDTSGRYVFYFVSATESSYSCPQLTVSPDFINAGEIDCGNLPQNSFKIRYSTFQMESLSGNEYKDPYIYIPTNGTLSISKDENDNYVIYFDMINEYTKGTGTEVFGDNYRLTITYRGVATAK